MPAHADLLRDVPLFQLLDDDERTALAAVLDEAQFAAGQCVFNMGDPGDAVYLIHSGEVELFVTDDTGQRITLATAQPGDLFGELSLLDGGPRSATAVATQPTETLVLDRDDLRLFLSRRPDAGLDMLAVMGRRLRETDKLLLYRATRNPNDEFAERATFVQRIADAAAVFSGSILFLALHILWFIAWVSINTGLVRAIAPFDRFPFGLLTMIVSLEAIFLSCLVLISQNRQAAKDRVRSDVEYEVNLKAELEITYLHRKVDHLYEELLARLDALQKSRP